MDNTTIYVNSEIGSCSEFILKGKKQTISVVISPLKVTSGAEVLRITSGCNFWKACENISCQFSQVAYGGPKKV
jgi:hypothetical protein